MSDRAVSVDSRLIYDVGMHLGEDTEYYLKRGFRVIAFEANPDLVAENKKNFADAIERGELIIVEGAIVEDPSVAQVTFYVNEDSSVWGTIHADFAGRNARLGTASRQVTVESVDFCQCLADFGVPYFMKIDIEGADMICLEALRSFSEKPSYISMESNKIDFSILLDEIDLMAGLGYDAFKAVQQGHVPAMKIPAHSVEGNVVEHVFSKEASGMFGSDLPGRWLSRDEVLARYRAIFREYKMFGDATFWQRNPVARKFLKGVTKLTGRHCPGWYDTHARHSSV
jgi:FkbM family methyltransferase